MTSSLADGDTIDFWFTQRIMKNLISGLTNWARGQRNGHHTGAQPDRIENCAAPIGSGAGIGANGDAPFQARSITEQATREILVTRLAVRTRGDALILDLPLGPDEKGCASFSRTTLNQWLAILYRQYLEAQWSLQDWPTWFQEAQEPTSRSARSRNSLKPVTATSQHSPCNATTGVRMTSPVSYEINDDIGVIRVDNPPVNALSQAVRQGIVDALEQARHDKSRVLVLICSGRTFIAGADITEFGKPPQAPSLSDVCENAG